MSFSNHSVLFILNEELNLNGQYSTDLSKFLLELNTPIPNSMVFREGRSVHQQRMQTPLSNTTLCASSKLQGPIEMRSREGRSTSHRNGRESPFRQGSVAQEKAPSFLELNDRD